MLEQYCREQIVGAATEAERRAALRLVEQLARSGLVRPSERDTLAS
jgi:hypothetical protein